MSEEGLTYSPKILIILKDLGNSDLYPIFSNAVSALAMTPSLRAMEAGIVMFLTESVDSLVTQTQAGKVSRDKRKLKRQTEGGVIYEPGS